MGVSDLLDDSESDEISVGNGPSCLILHIDHSVLSLLVKDSVVDESIVEFAQSFLFAEEFENFFNGVVDGGHSL